MKIAIVHSFYSSAVPSGENEVVLAQKRALVDAGHEVLLVAWYSDMESKAHNYRLKAAWWTVSGYGRDPRTLLEDFDPDIVHVHNLFPNIGTRWLQTRRWPVVCSLHNYRPVCANGLLYRDGQECRDCIEVSWTSAIKYGCYRDSKVASTPIAIRNRQGVSGNALLSSADVVSVPSRRALQAYEALGMSTEKLRLLPYFVDDVYRPIPSQPETPKWLVASRLSPEKGVMELVGNWPQGQVLEIAGSGTEEVQISQAVPGNVRLLGLKSHEWLADNMPSYTGLVFPGRSKEGIPTVVLQALGAGIPVVAREGNGAADLVIEEKIGAAYSEGSADSTLEVALDSTHRGGIELRRKARHLYERDFSVDTWVRRAELLYADAIKKWNTNR